MTRIIYALSATSTTTLAITNVLLSKPEFLDVYYIVQMANVIDVEITSLWTHF